MCNVPAPKNPNTGPATASVRRRALERKAERLRLAGWVVIPPERLAELPLDLVRTEYARTFPNDDETDYLMREPANARRLLEAVDRMGDE